MQVHVGPEWYLEHQDLALHEHEAVHVSGALAEVEGQAVPRDCVGGGFRAACSASARHPA